MGALRPAPARPPHSLTALVAPTPHQTPQRQPPDFCQQHPFLWACSPYPTPSEHERQEAFHAATCRGRAGCTPTPRAPLSGHGLSGRLWRGRQPRWCPLPLGLEGELHPPCTPAPLSHCPGPCEAQPSPGWHAGEPQGAVTASGRCSITAPATGWTWASEGCSGPWPPARGEGLGSRRLGALLGLGGGSHSPQSWAGSLKAKCRSSQLCHTVQAELGGGMPIAGTPCPT